MATAKQYIRTLPTTDLEIAPDATTGEVIIGNTGSVIRLNGNTTVNTLNGVHYLNHQDGNSLRLGQDNTTDDIFIGDTMTTGEISIGNQSNLTKVKVPVLEVETIEPENATSDLTLAENTTGDIHIGNTFNRTHVSQLAVDNIYSKSGTSISLNGEQAANLGVGVNGGDVDLSCSVAQDLLINSNGTAVPASGNIEIGTDPRGSASQILIGSSENDGQVIFQNFSSQCNIGTSGKITFSSDKLVQIKSTDASQKIVVSAEDGKIYITGDLVINGVPFNPYP